MEWAAASVPLPSPSYWQGRRIVAAGGRGFLGRHLARRLEALGARVLPLSRADGCDLRDPRQAQAFLARTRPEIVFNLAANQGGVAYQRTCPGTILHDNVLIGVNTMEAARLAGAERYVNVVAACAYPDDPPDGLLREAELEAGPMHPSADNYGISKRVTVLQARYYRQEFGFPVSSVAFANTYGPGDHFASDRSHVFGALLRRFHEAQRDGRPEVVVWGRGVAVRDLLYVDDAITGLLLAVERCPDVELLNVGSGRGYSIAEIAETIRSVVGYEGRVAFDPSRPEGPLKKTLDISRLRSLIGWTPPTSLAEGTRETLAWLNEHYQEAVDGN